MQCSQIQENGLCGRTLTLRFMRRDSTAIHSACINYLRARYFRCLESASRNVECERHTIRTQGSENRESRRNLIIGQ